MTITLTAAEYRRLQFALLCAADDRESYLDSLNDLGGTVMKGYEKSAQQTRRQIESIRRLQAKFFEASKSHKRPKMVPA